MKLIKDFLGACRAIKRDGPLTMLTDRLAAVRYSIKCFVKPYNRINIQHLDRTWCDRDELMFHAMFQILVDFVELETPFIDWDDRRFGSKKRHTNIADMHAYNEAHFGPTSYQDFHCEWYTDDERAAVDAETRGRYLINKEILYLYSWYKNKSYELSLSTLYAMTGEKLEFVDGVLSSSPHDVQGVITPREVFEIEEEHNVVRERMLERILAVRGHLWT